MPTNEFHEPEASRPAPRQTQVEPPSEEELIGGQRTFQYRPPTPPAQSVPPEAQLSAIQPKRWSVHLLRPSAVAGAIAGVIRDSGVAEVQSIGAGATNQAIKAVAIARSYLSEEGIDIVCTPSFIDVSIDDEERTAIRLFVEKR